MEIQDKEQKKTRVYKSWEVGETSYIYWLVIYGLSNKDISEILAYKLLPNRTRDSVSGQATDVRKFINQAKGQKLNHPVRESSMALFRRAAKVLPIPEILKYRPEVIKEVAPIRYMSPRSSPQDTSPPIEDKLSHEVVEDIIINKTKINLIEPSILDVMRLAHELQAKEVEYKDMKIKF